MAFANNSSAFGIKPAGTPSLFGQSNTTGTQPSLFANASQPSNTGFGAFGQTQNQTPVQGQSLFGTPQGQNAHQQTQTPSLFGQPTVNTQQQGQAPSLFGQANTNTQQGQTPSSFGQTKTNSQQVQTPSLFGQTNTNTQQGQTSSLFGQSNAQQGQTTNLFGQPNTNAQQGQTTSVFSQPSTNTQQAPSLFGNTQQSNQKGPSLWGTSGGQQQSGLGGSLFGGNTNTSTGSTLGQSTLGSWGSTAMSTQQPATGLGASILGSTAPAGSLFGKPSTQLTSLSQNVAGPPLFTRLSKFNDLPDDLKKTFEDIEHLIQGRIQISKDLKQRKLGEEATKGQESIRNIHKELMNSITTLHSDVLHTRDLKTKVDQTVQDTIVATRIVDGFRNPQQHGAHLKNHANFPLEFFQRISEQLRERLRWYKTTIEQIERKLSSAAVQSQYTPQAITSTLEAQHATFIALASKTAALDAELQKIKALYTQLWRAKTGSMRDPFYDLDRGSSGEFGLESIAAK